MGREKNVMLRSGNKQKGHFSRDCLEVPPLGVLRTKRLLANDGLYSSYTATSFLRVAWSFSKESFSLTLQYKGFGKGKAERTEWARMWEFYITIFLKGPSFSSWSTTENHLGLSVAVKRFRTHKYKANSKC